MKASIIVAVYADKRIIRCIESLLDQEFPMKSYEIIIIENGSSKFRKECEDLGCRYFHIKEKNMAAARNKGVKEARGTYVLFTDADCVALKTWVKNMVRCMEEKNSDVLGGKIERFQPKTRCEKYCSNIGNNHDELQTYKPVIDYPYVVLANAAFQKKDIVDAGFFDEDLLSGNDVDICWKLFKLGKKLSLCKNALVYHQNRKSWKGLFNAHKQYATFMILLFEKYKKDIKEQKKKQNKTIVTNTYPFKLFLSSMVNLIIKPKSFYKHVFRMIEALGILAGMIRGSLKVRKLPIY